MSPEEFSDKFMTTLNEQQQKAVHTVDGAVLLLAVPGSGKTTVLVTRLGYMVLCCGIDPTSILTMTYTVAATKEMRQRFANMFGSEYSQAIEFRTINGISAKIVDYYSRTQGKRQPFDLLENSGEISRIIGQIYQNINNEYATESAIKDIKTCITYIKNMMLNKQEIKELDTDIEKMAEIYAQYVAELKRRRLMDFDDQMTYALTILNTYPAILEHFQEKYKYICVDESQDTSKIQHEIIRLLAQKSNNIFMVGDEDQSIYGFRAAYPEALMNFKSTYPNAEILFIEQNYRSTNQIVAAANKFVSKNRFRYEKTIVPTRGEGLPIKIIDAANRKAQYKYLFAVAKSCKSETTVLFRNNDSSLPLIDTLERNGIPYNCRQFDGVFFTNKVVTDITDIINFAYNPFNADCFMRIYYKLGCAISKKAATFACEQSRTSDKPILDALLEFSEIRQSTVKGVSALKTTLSSVTRSNGKQAIYTIWHLAGYGEYVAKNNLDSGKYTVLRLLGENEPDARGLLRRLDELHDIIINHTNSPKSKLMLSTIHSSKGLEYERVYLLDVIDGILPSEPSPNTTSQEEIKLYEEERRLFYVGITRAKNELFLFNCFDEDCSFVNEIVEKQSDTVKNEPKSKTFSAPKDVKEISALAVPGKRVEHNKFGKGVIIKASSSTVTVKFFSSKSIKQFDLLMSVKNGFLSF